QAFQDNGVRAGLARAGAFFVLTEWRMSLKGFLRSGHTPTLFSAFLYFGLSFMVWVLLGPLAVQVSAALHLNAAQQGLRVARAPPSASPAPAIPGPCWPRCSPPAWPRRSAGAT